MRTFELYISIWVSETEEWFYFKNEFNEEQFAETGYVDYYTLVDNKGIIVFDSYLTRRMTQKFESVCDIRLWD